MPPSSERRPAADAELRNQMAEAAALYGAGRLEAAEAALAVVMQAADYDLVARAPALWELRGAVALARRRPAEAVAALEQAVALAPAAVDLRLHLATAREAAGDAAGAAEALEAALAAAPGRHDIDARLASLLWQLGRPDAAIAAFARLANAGPGDPATRNRLGMALAVAGRTVEALGPFLHLVASEPYAAGPARDLAQVLAALGAASAARAWYARALVLQPGEPVAAAALAGPAADDRLGPLADPVRALVAACHALALRPEDAGAHVVAARGLRALPDPLAVQGAAAAALLRRSLELRPDDAEVMVELAGLVEPAGGAAEAEALLRRALRLAPADAALHAGLGAVLKRQWRTGEAAQCYRTALALAPDQAHLLCNLADALLADGPSEEAVALLRRALALEPGRIEAQAWLGMALGLAQRHEAALAALQPALAARPDEPSWHLATAASLLALGRFEEGWAEYAWRWRMPEQALGPRQPENPFLQPDPAGWAGRTVLIHAEQGHGDTLQFLRYARLAAARGARVLLEVQPGLKRLAASIPGLAGVFAYGEPVPAFDVAVPLLHLPWAFGTRLESIPATVPYVRPDLGQAAAFRRRMQGLPGLKVGLVWSGDPRPHLPGASLIDRRRSLALAALAPLAGIAGVVFVSLQKGAGAAQAAAPPAGMVLHDWTGELADFADTAALMAALDLVITVDSAPVHLAGALGRPVWMLNRFDSCWRWLVERDDSPWYPTLRQFRQEVPGDWSAPVAAVAVALRAAAERGAVAR